MRNAGDNSERIPTKEELQILRTEIIESEKVRIELLKYKLIAVASIATIGLGFSGDQSSAPIMDADYVLCIIPFVCIYVDLLCYHNNIRILFIAYFLRHYRNSYEGYIVKIHDMCAKGERYLFGLEDFALFWSSMGLSILLIVYGIFNVTCTSKGNVFLITGLVTTVLIVLTKLSFAVHQKALISNADKYRLDCD
ncbi:MAG: hypothetical protein WAW61_21765 [Methylococcaceae bacterium]